MSDGMSDARALAELEREVARAAYALHQALKRADEGHRGLAIDVLDAANLQLVGSGYKVFRTRYECRYCFGLDQRHYPGCRRPTQGF